VEIQFYGANCVRITTKQASIIVDDNLSKLGGKSVTKLGDIALFTGVHDNVSQDIKLAVDLPGEYEISGVSIHGIAAQAHIDERGSQAKTVYKVTAADIRVCVVGHIHPDLSEKQLESIGTVDVLVIPVGGNGFTLDPIGALKVIRAIEPKLVIPTHYDDKKLNFEVPQRTLDDALKELSMDAKEMVDKLKLKAGDLPETTELIVLNTV
jgi:L-ascorbate metabolism protein UlaG (beta-lactamase superfamily)